MKIFASELALAISLMAGPQGATTDDAQVRDLVCMARNIYHEARGEPTTGQAAVAYVVLNRTESPGFPTTPCEVVFEDNQFSWTERAQDAYPHEWDAYRKAMEVAIGVMEGTIHNPIDDAVYFYAGSVTPRWARGFDRVATIGAHRFYRDDDAQG